MEKRNTMIAVSGDPDEYMPFLVSKTELFRDTLHLTDCATPDKKTPSVPVGKFLKDNKKHIPNLPDKFDTDSKIKKLRIAAFLF